MKKALFLCLISIPVLASGQVVTFAKTLPQSGISVGAGGAYNYDVFAFDNEGMSAYLHAGYGIQYSLDVNLKYHYYANGKDYVGVDLQYLFYETRKSYISAITGLHYWENLGFDLTGVYTYDMRYWLNLSLGLDMNLDFTSDVNPRFWVPLNLGINVTEQIFTYAEYCFPVSERAFGVVSIGANFVFR